ncbi:MAG: Gfo/Idh/MocA family oxidoreductase [Ignavibacteria bacterium]|jgi:predicted dehydrogenase
MSKVKWGVISTSNFARTTTIPAMQKAEYCDLTAVASRNISSAKQYAEQLGIPKAYGSYDELLADPEIEAVYIPLPNHKHLEWTKKSLEAGKHVLCEKPITLNAAEAEELKSFAEKYTTLKVMEAFMYRLHPQYKKVKQWLAEKAIGDIKSVFASFSFYNDDISNIRNIAEVGGGGLLDIGCYCINGIRFIMEREPKRVISEIKIEPEIKVDSLVAGLLDFGNTTANFVCSIRAEYSQRMIINGTKGNIEIEFPFTPELNDSANLRLNVNSKIEDFATEKCNQYTIEFNMFSQAILNGTPVPTPLDDAIENMKVIDAVKESAEKGAWVQLNK